MITHEKLRVFEKYRGDMDDWARLGTPEEKHLLKDDDWYEISGVIRQLAILKLGLASTPHYAGIQELLSLQVPDHATQLRLRALA